ncbi:hypothetical protein H8S33_18700 [Ornithinibacillus sp. BX22]|uniref:Uncharacterized protein n=1 Tax=Ornithinibacillus hominis TaxID=2763055 RepID=A0A923L9K1_9BACI|nr:hypothetical protein [Ornithinibacillus hominis]MBC5638804.1 hypothetical protein [Ornithinibacillus hominis]
MLSSRDFHDVVQLAFDRPGYGYSERSKNVKVTRIFQACLINKALKELSID